MSSILQLRNLQITSQSERQVVMTTMGLEENDQKEEEGEVSAPTTVTLKLESSPSLSMDLSKTLM